jgi:hypothetical protein
MHALGRGSLPRAGDLPPTGADRFADARATTAAARASERTRGIGRGGALALTLCLSGCGDDGAGTATATDTDTQGNGSMMRWQLAYEASDAEGAVMSAWGPEPGIAWAVGGQPRVGDQPGSGLLLRRTPSAAGPGTWSAAPLPAGTPMLNWVHGVETAGGGLRRVMVGEDGVVLRRDDLGDDADGWVREPTDVTAPLWGVFMLDVDRGYAVGGDASGEGPPVLLERDGDGWRSVPLPPLDRPSAALFKVWASGPADVIAVGASGVILRFDGAQWQQETWGGARDLISLWGRSGDDVVAVGGRSNGTIVRWDGTTWTPAVEGALPGLSGVWMAPSGVAAIVGDLGLAGVLPPGSDAAALDESDAGTLLLHATYGWADGPVVAVGGSLTRNPPYVGVIVERELPL